MTTIITTTKIATMMRTTIIPAAIAPILVDPPDEGWLPPPLEEVVDVIITKYIRNKM